MAKKKQKLPKPSQEEPSKVIEGEFVEPKKDEDDYEPDPVIRRLKEIKSTLQAKLDLCKADEERLKQLVELERLRLESMRKKLELKTNEPR